MDVHAPDRIATIHLRLLQEPDPLVRASLHLEAASLRMSEGQFELAARHFREALHLDDSLEVARARLRELGVGVPVRRGLRGWLARHRR